jgi:2-keto-4-pentenoate hydratase/2-oxohepta-3-ene-1,7-dioic acid hydratase in catechol pathway
MKLLRLGEKGKEIPAVLVSDGQAADVSSVVRDFDCAFFSGGGIDQVKTALDRGGLRTVRVSDHRIGPPIARPSKLMAVGLNYSDHAKETNAAIPDKPIFFDKATTAIVGPNDDIVLPSNYETVDYEVELALLIGRRARRVSQKEALAYVAGYLICNDVTERTAQKKEGGQWYRAKSFDTFAPLGPYLVTTDEIGDPRGLSLTCRIDGALRQNGNTSNLIFDIPYLIEFISRNITLEPGDIITTGTPAGVGVGMHPPAFLKPGQVIELEVTGLGQQRSRVVREID